jgi:PAS domain S-box-containing protein
MEIRGVDAGSSQEQLVAALAEELRREVLQRQRAEKDLRLSQERFARLSGAGVVGIVIADLQGRILEANRAYLRLVGYSLEDLAAGRLNWREMTPPEGFPSGETFVSRFTSEGAAGPFEIEQVRKDGTRVPVLVSVAVLEGDQVIAIVSDLTDRNAAVDAHHESEERLRQAQKLEAIGILSDGVVHDFNNLLSVILSYSGLLINQFDPSSTQRQDMLEIRSAATRAADLARQLIMFGRQNVVFQRVIEVSEILGMLEKMVRPILGEDIELIVTGNGSLKVNVDPTTIEQAMLNLVANARDAMPAGGRLSIDAQAVTLDDAAAALVEGASAGPYVVLSVSDTGLGMNAAVMENLFKPFFTTKKKGKGTGLGLSTARGIVKQNGGTISVSSASGRGTTFRLYFPRCVAHEEAPPPPESIVSAGNETILLVEDDDSLRAAERTILRGHGYRVLEARNAGEALLISERTREPIHLLLSDVVMPFMSGLELATRLRTVHPELRVLFASGYAADTLARHGLFEGSPQLLRKPITPDVLTWKVRQTLDRPVTAQA